MKTEINISKLSKLKNKNKNDFGKGNTKNFITVFTRPKLNNNKIIMWLITLSTITISVIVPSYYFYFYTLIKLCTYSHTIIPI